MNTPWLVVVVLAAVALPAFAEKNWADRAEYELYSSISGVADPVSQIALLYEWEARYPQTEFQAERLLTLSEAYFRAGKAAEAFATIGRLLELDSHSEKGLLWTVTIGPTLTQPTAEDLDRVTDAANKLLMPRPVVKVLEMSGGPLKEPTKVAQTQKTQASVEPPASDLSPDAESQRVDALVRDMRRTYRPTPDPQIAKRALAEEALAWVKSQRP